MKIRFLIILLSICCGIQSCKEKATPAYKLQVQSFNLNIKNSLRGLCVTDENIVWVGGSQGIYLFTEDGGNHWTIDSIPGAHNLDFRSILALDANTVIAVSSGTPARVYKTSNKGKNWKITYSSNDPSIFLDAISFWDNESGLIMGDPTGGHLFLLKTNNAGETWKQIPKDRIPASLPIEGGFASSGTCITTFGNSCAWAATGGDSARVYSTVDKGKNWTTINTPILSGGQMKGIYSLSFKNEMMGIAVGGEWNAIAPKNSKAYTLDGGKTWTLGKNADSYSSGSCYIKDNIFLACGQSGTDLSTDNGKTWQHIHDEHLYGLAFDDSGNTGYGTGPKGKIVKLQLISLKK